MTDQLRLLAVHAHPDDETLATGVAVAHHVARGDEVTVLTCTLGEQGEVIPPELAHLDADHEDTLGEFRRDELRGELLAGRRVVGHGLAVQVDAGDPVTDGHGVDDEPRERLR